MSLKHRLQQQLIQARQYSEQLLGAFHTPEQWTHQVHARANHALWFAGHMGVTDNFVLSLIAPNHAQVLPLLQDRFGMGSTPSARASDYPPVSEVLDYMRNRRKALIDLLESMSDAELNQPTPKGAPGFMPDVASCFQMIAWHEGLHSGQLSVAHRALGNPPVMAPPPAAQ